jgi:uncharacterized protein (UPF0332 family)
MGQAENKLRWCLKKAEAGGKNHRGLRKAGQDIEKAEKHIEKAMHNLAAMQYLLKGGYSDWAVSAGFYTMYHCLLALLAKHGYESKNQACTLAAAKVLINEGKSELKIGQLKRIASFDENSEAEEFIRLREEFQYGTATAIDREIAQSLVQEAKEFVEAARLDLKR